MTNADKIAGLDKDKLAEFILSLLKGEGEPDGYEYHCENCPVWSCTNIEPEEQCCFATLMIWLGKEEEESEVSKMKEAATILGVEIWEEFKVTGIDNYYRITDSRFEAISLLSGEWVEAPASVLYELLTGNREIIRKPWKPKDGEQYWCATYCGVLPNEWQGGMMDLAYYAVGNCFRTEEEVDTHKAEILARLEKIYEDGKPLIGAEG